MSSKRMVFKAFLGVLLLLSLAVPHEAEAARGKRRSSRGALAGIGETTATIGSTAISPVLTTTIRGASMYWKADAEERAELPWFASPYVFLPFAAFLLFVLFKDSIGEAVPPAKKAGDVVDVLTSKAGAVMALPAVVPLLGDALGDSLAVPIEHAMRLVEGVAYAGGSETGFGVSDLAAAVGTSLGYALGGAVFVVMWLAGHTTSVLTLMSPVPLVGAVIKSVRLSLLAILAGAATIHPVLGLVVASLYLYVAIRVAGWSFRLTVFGWVLSRDLLLRKWRSYAPRQSFEAFVARGYRDLPPRTYGTLSTESGTLKFTYRPLLLFKPRTSEVTLDAGMTLAIGKGLLGPVLISTKEGDETPIRQLFRFPPRYRTHEPELARSLGDLQVRDVSVVRGFRAAWAWVKGQVSNKSGDEVSPVLD